MLNSVKQFQLLNTACEKGIIDFDQISVRLREMKNLELLSLHTQKIWEGSNGKWYTYVVENGKRRLIKRSSKDAINTFLIFFYQSVEDNKIHTFSDDFWAWIKQKEEWNEIDPSTVIRYQNDFRRFFPEKSEMYDIPVCDINELILEDFIKKTIKEFSLTAKSYQNLKILLNGTLKYAKKHGHTSFSIGTFFADLEISDKTFKKPSKKSTIIYSRKEREILYNYFMSDQKIWNLALALQCLTGLRMGELSTLKREDNIEDGKLFIRRTEVRYLDENGKQKVGIKEEAKQGHDGIIFIPKAAQRIIQLAYMQTHDSEYLFSVNGERLSESKLSYRLEMACKECGIEYKSSHKMRKTYASMLLDARLSEKIVQGQMRHKHIETTRQYYYFDIGDKDESIAEIERVVSIR